MPASPRNQFRHDETDPKSLQGFDTDPASIPYLSGPSYGTDWKDKVVKITAAGLVQKCADGDEFLGVLEQVTFSNTCRVQIHGLRVLSCASGAALPLNARVVADANGGVKAATGAAGFGRVVRKIDTTHVLVDL